MQLTFSHDIPRAHLDEGLTRLTSTYARYVFGKDGPPIYVLEPEDESAGLIRGRYFPSKGVALVLRHSDNWVTIATALHETAHCIVYKRRCGCHHATHRCGYVGHHDAGFRKTVEELYNNAEVPAYAREAVEGTVEA